MIQTSRRGFLGFLLAAPVIVKATSLMAIKPVYAGEGLRITSAMEADFCTENLKYRAVEKFSLMLRGWDQYGNPKTEILEGYVGDTVRSMTAWGSKPA